MRNFILGVAATFILAIVIGGAYFLGSKNSKSNDSQVKVTPTQEVISPTSYQPSVASPTPTTKPVSNVSEQIIAVIKTKNTQPLEGYMTDSVNVRLESSSCCGLISKSQAISQLSYLDQAVNWDFDPSNPIIQNLAATVPDNYGAGWTVGVSSNEYVFSFKINDQDKVDAYNIASTYKLLLPQ